MYSKKIFTELQLFKLCLGGTEMTSFTTTTSVHLMREYSPVVCMVSITKKQSAACRNAPSGMSWHVHLTLMDNVLVVLAVRSQALKVRLSGACCTHKEVMRDSVEKRAFLIIFVSFVV